LDRVSYNFCKHISKENELGKKKFTLPTGPTEGITCATQGTRENTTVHQKVADDKS
jgi:hypothetical protein